MFIGKNFAPAIIAALMLLNASCSSESNTSDTQDNDAGTQSEETNDTIDTEDNSNTGDENTGDENTGNENTADDDNDQTGNAGLFGPPQFNIAECSSAEITTAQAPNDVNAPTTITTGQLVQGQLSEDSSVLSFDVWQIDLQPGNYHLLVDTWMASEGFGYHGVNITSLGETSDDDERLLRLATPGFHERAYEYLEILNPTLLKIKVEPVYNDTMNYVLGVFPNGSSVPSPRFTDCPPTIRASLDTTTSVTLDELNSTEDYRWIQMNLNAGVYTLDTSMQSSDAYTGFQVELLQQFGEDEGERVAREANSSTAVTSSDQFTVLEDGEVWLRVENVYDNGGTLELTVRR